MSGIGKQLVPSRSLDLTCPTCGFVYCLGQPLDQQSASGLDSLDWIHDPLLGLMPEGASWVPRSQAGYWVHVSLIIYRYHHASPGTPWMRASSVPLEEKQRFHAWGPWNLRSPAMTLHAVARILRKGGSPSNHRTSAIFPNKSFHQKRGQTALAIPPVCHLGT